MGESRVRQVSRDDHIRPVTLPCVHINHGQLKIIAEKSVIISSVTCSVQCLDIIIITESVTMIFQFGFDQIVRTIIMIKFMVMVLMIASKFSPNGKEESRGPW